MNNPPGVSPSKGKQGTTRGKEKIFWPRWESNPRPELILCSTICVPSATRHNIHMYPYFIFSAIHHRESSPAFSVRPCSSVGRVTVDLFRRSWVRFPPRSKDFFFASCGSLAPFTRANAQWVIHGYTSELILCSTICVPSATRHNIHMYPSENSWLPVAVRV